jgi:2-deoxy-D-gluconate 3-dehydrogenase
MASSPQVGYVGGQDRSFYSATKHAVEGFTEPTAIELGVPRIHVSSIGPTFKRMPRT